MMFVNQVKLEMIDDEPYFNCIEDTDGKIKKEKFEPITNGAGYRLWLINMCSLQWFFLFNCSLQVPPVFAFAWKINDSHWFC